MSREFLLLAEALAGEKNVSEDIVFDALEFALAGAVRKQPGNERFDIRVQIDRETGEYKAFRRWEIVSAEDYTDAYKQKIDEAVEELKIIREELKAFAPDKVVWDIEDLSKQPPWGNDISKDITDLSNYFVSSEGKDLFTVFFDALQKAKDLDSELQITSL